MKLILFQTVTSGILALIPGHLLASLAMNIMGPKRNLQILTGISIMFWLLLSFSPTLWTIYVSRISLGIISGMSLVLTQVLITEISEPEIRGFVSGLAHAMVIVGAVYTSLLINFLPWKFATILCCAPNLYSLLLVNIVPEVSHLFIMKLYYNTIIIF